MGTKKVSEYEQEMPKSLNADKPTTPWWRYNEYRHPQHNQVQQPALTSSAGWLLDLKGHQKPHHISKTQIKIPTPSASNNKQWKNNNRITALEQTAY